MLLKKEAIHLLDSEAPLTEEEKNVMLLIVDGYNIDRIAERLGEPSCAIEDIIDGVVNHFEEYLAS